MSTIGKHIILLGSALLLCLGTLAEGAEFPQPEGASWSTLVLTQTRAESIADNGDGYVLAGTQVGMEGPALDIWAALVRLDGMGNVVNTKTFDGEDDHTEAFDIIASYAGDGLLDGYLVAGGRHHLDIIDREEYYMPYAWLVKVGTNLEKEWEQIYGAPFTDYGYQVQPDGDGFVIGGMYSNGTLLGSWTGYLIGTDGEGLESWSLYMDHPGGVWYVQPIIYGVCPTADGGYILATDEGLYKLNGGSPPTLAWVTGDDAYTSVIEVADGYVATGSVQVRDDDGDHQDLVLIKVDRTGNVVFRQPFGRSAPCLGATGMDDEGKEVIQTADGGFAVVGTTESYGWHGNGDIWLLKTDGTGHLLWDVALGEAEKDSGAGIIEEDDGSLVVAGTARWEDSFWMFAARMAVSYQPPTAIFEYSPEPPLFEQMTLTFDGSDSFDPDGTLIRYEWDFGDGYSSAGAVTTHAFAAAGVYTVTLYVTDNEGVRSETSRTLLINALEYQWELQFQGSRDYGLDMVRASDGGYLIGGANHVGTNVSSDMELIKTDSLGRIEWRRIYRDPVYGSTTEYIISLTLAHDGHLIALGNRNTTSDYLLEGADIKLMKIALYKDGDLNPGDIIWERVFDYGYGDDPVMVKPASDGGYIILCSVSVVVQPDPLQVTWTTCLIKTNEDGEEIWSQFYEHHPTEPLHRIKGLAVLPVQAGGYLVSCDVYNYSPYAPLLVIRTDEDGDETWRRTYGNDTTKSSMAMIFETTGHDFVLAGKYRSEYGMMKIEPDGDPIWMRQWESGSMYDTLFKGTEAPDGGFVLTGYVSTDVSPYKYNLYLARTDAEGHIAWEKTMGEADVEYTGKGIDYLDDGSLVVLATRTEAIYPDLWLFKLGPNLIPHGDFSYDPMAPVTGDIVTFTADVGDDDGTVGLLYWDFGDGVTGTSITDTVYHRYTIPGTVTVTLTVSDNDGGLRNVSHEITVSGDLVDLCPDDPLKTAPGACGCGTPDTDYDRDGLYDCEDADADNDGYDSVLFGGLDGNDFDRDINPESESGPDGSNPTYDGNVDGIPDRDQAHVMSLASADGGAYVTVVTPPGTVLSGVSATASPSPYDEPDADFPYGFFSFTVSGLALGESVDVTLIFPEGPAITQYFKHGPTPDNAADHWYEFLYDGSTGAEISGNVVTLHLTDGARGDADVSVNGRITDPGGPVATVSDPQGTGDDTDGGGGGGGCFVSGLY